MPFFQADWNFSVALEVYLYLFTRGGFFKQENGYFFVPWL
jgi:hypothetical protein